MSRSRTVFEALIGTYAYHQASILLDETASPDLRLLLSSLVERRELNVAFLYEHFGEIAELSDRYDLPKLSDQQTDEQLVNYLYDLEAKVKNGQIIDFVRSVSPIIYRLYQRLLIQQIPDLPSLIKNAQDAEYDRWLFQRLQASQHPVIQAYISRKRDSRVTSSSLADLIELTDLPQAIKDSVQLLRQFEKSVRNPLAHLIKPFDEAELHRTTGFSSQKFLDELITLAQATGLSYDDSQFYFDQANQVLLELY